MIFFQLIFANDFRMTINMERPWGILSKLEVVNGNLYRNSHISIYLSIYIYIYICMYMYIDIYICMYILYIYKLIMTLDFEDKHEQIMNHV